MTSILLTVRIVSAAADAAAFACVAADMAAPLTRPLPAVTAGGGKFRCLRCIVAAVGAVGPARVRGGIVVRCRFRQWTYLRLERADPVGPLRPLCAIPLRHVGRVVTVVVFTRDLYRRGKAFSTDFLEARLGDVLGLKTAAHVFAVDNLLASDLLRIADRFRDDDRVEHTAIIEVLAYAILRRLGLAFVDDVFLDVLDDREVGADLVEVKRQIALGTLAGRPRIVIAARPPVTDEMIHRVVVLHGLFHCGRIHRSEALDVDPVRTIAADVEPLRGLVLHFGRGHWIELELESVVLGERFEQRDRLLAVGRVEVDQTDLLALELVEAAFLAADVADEHRGAVPVGRRRIEDPWEGRAVRGRGETVSHRQNRNLVDRGFRDDLQSDAGRIGIDHVRILRFYLFVAFDTLLGVVARLAFLDEQLYAADAAIALIEHVEIVGHAVHDRRAGNRERSGAIRQQWNENTVCRARGNGCERQPGDNRKSGPEQTTIQSHLVFLPLDFLGGSAACCSSAAGCAPPPSPYPGVLGVIVPRQ